MTETDDVVVSDDDDDGCTVFDKRVGSITVVGVDILNEDEGTDVRGSEVNCALIGVALVAIAEVVDVVGTEISEAREKLNEGRETAPPPKESTELDGVVVVEKTGTLLDGTPNALAPIGGTGMALAPPPPPPPNGTAPPNGDGETPPTLLLLLLLVFPH